MTPDDPTRAAVHLTRGDALLGQGRAAEALIEYERALSLEPAGLDARFNRANALFDLGRFEAAVDDFDAIVGRDPSHVPALNNRGLALLCLGRPAEAVMSFDRALALEPANADTLFFRANALQEQGALAAALAGYDAALALAPQNALAHNGRGSTLARLQRHSEALASYERALALRPRFAEALLNRGNVQTALRRWTDALASFDAALALKPDFAVGCLNRGNVLFELGRFDDATASYDRAIALDPRLAQAYYGRGNAHRGAGRAEAALTDFDHALRLDPDAPFLRGLRRHVRMALGDWRDFDEEVAALERAIVRGAAVSPPFPMLALCASSAVQRRAAEIWMRHQVPPSEELSGPMRAGEHVRIRVGYFSADFREHPIAELMAGVFEQHDRSRLEITAFAFGPRTDDAMRGRLEHAFDRFLDVDGSADRDVARLARELGIDIAVDLMGFTQGSRPGIFARRAAPLQVSYLGYLGTLGSPFMDYLVADAALVAAESRPHYSESILYLPSYQANARRRAEAAPAFTRAQAGLPAQGFVFCCFNNNYKITPHAFAAWLRILAAVPHGVLHLYAGSEAVERNLRREAQARGMDDRRLVFGGRLSLSEYRARYGAVDLFLDTWPYNAGSTAADALWAGVPVLTHAGPTFAGRMAASLLTALDLPELIATSLADYENMAVTLATDPQRFAALKARLDRHRLTHPLYDLPRFVRTLEAGYAQILDRHRNGLPCADVWVAPQESTAAQPGA